MFLLRRSVSLGLRQVLAPERHTWVARQPMAWTASRQYANRQKTAKFKRSKAKLKPLTFAIPPYISVNNLANLLKMNISMLIGDLKKLGFEKAKADYIIPKDYIELILEEYNYQIPSTRESTTPENVYDELKQPADPKALKDRPPVVTIMGHVDHGKTTILDYLRKSSIVSQEFGGITQHIGAFQVVTPVSKRKITFLDTPGHEAFLKMRERGANITDIVILVVSAEDSIKPQTIEAIKHVKKSGNELIVAITKVDKFRSAKEKEAAVNKIMTDLLQYDIHAEDLGGNVPVIPISAKSGENMDLLEENIILVSDGMELQAEVGKKTHVEGWVLESEVQKTLGNVSTVLIKKGILRKGSVLLSGNTYCKVRNLIDENGASVASASPAQAVEVTGWKQLPMAGDQVIQVESESTAKKYVSKRLHLIELEKEATTVDKINEARTQVNETPKDEDTTDVEPEPSVPEGPRNVNFIVKADFFGSVEAITESISHLGNDEVVCKVVESSVGIPTINDLNLARITNSVILCFNLGNLPGDILNNKEKIEIRQYTVIYKLIEDVTERLTEQLTPIYEDKVIATVDIKEIFTFDLKNKVIRIAGCKVNNGKLSRSSLVKVTRGPEEKVIFDGKLATLKQGKESMKEVTKGNECGVTFEDFEDYLAGDKILVYEKVKVPRYL
ncbi:AaceriAEL034Wp [[Ashbya] aceris (nom. inval.)]|nr:AaceriAEL034Wp [[Ashbya] aceris (nom. inval.)]